MESTACVALPFRDDSFSVCIPVSEILRWCYGNSSRKRHAVLSDDLGGALAEVRQAADIEDGQYDLTLPAGFVNQDGPTLMWLTSDDITLEPP